MVQIVHAAVRGRVRLKVEGLYGSHELKRHLEERLSENVDITHVSASPLTGNVLVIHNASRTAREIEKELGGLLPSRVDADEGSRPLRLPVPARPTVPAGTSKKRPCPAKEAQDYSSWHLRQPCDVFTASGVSPDTGLTPEAYGENLRRFGPNILPESVPRSAWSILAEQFKSLPVLLLGVAAGLSLFTGGPCRRGCDHGRGGDQRRHRLCD